MDTNTKDKQKIMYVVTKANWGGAQKYVFDLATTLPQDKYEVLVVHGEGEILNKKLNDKKIRTIRISEMGRDINIIKEIISSIKLFKIIFDESPDVVHLNSSKAGGLGALIARLNFTNKIIFTAHGWAFNERQFDNLTYKILSWLTVLLSHKTIVLSNENLEQGRKFLFAKNKIFQINNGIKNIDFKKRELARQFVIEKTGASSDTGWLVTISELHKNKGLEYLIKSISYLKEKPEVFIIGEGEERSNLEKLIKELSLEKNIYLMGFVEEANTYLKAFDAFVLSSVKEGLPFALLEAGLAKLPVIGSNIPGIRDIIDSEVGIKFESRDYEDLSIKIDNLLKDGNKMAQLGHNLNRKMVSDFSFEKMLNETTSLY